MTLRRRIKPYLTKRSLAGLVIHFTSEVGALVAVLAILAVIASILLAIR